MTVTLTKIALLVALALNSPSLGDHLLVLAYLILWLCTRTRTARALETAKLIVEHHYMRRATDDFKKAS